MSSPSGSSDGANLIRRNRLCSSTWEKSRCAARSRRRFVRPLLSARGAVGRWLRPERLVAEHACAARAATAGTSRGSYSACSIDARPDGLPTEGLHPLLVKIAPDLDATQLREICDLARPSRTAWFARNTSATEQGGISGRPLFGPSTAVVRAVRAASGANYPLIGVGGIFTGR